ncbi:MAG: general secretion pathway protein GspB [Proteobacteria bacterium]|nr:general secretion pathway protein GspB [Pseudomonadota bacterium]MBU1648958.1 general secretion pathway protein GspB [Pseudomonadota bacterium]
MSYILEALKKSDRERKQGEVPDLQSDHALRSGHGKREKRSSFGQWILLGVVVVLLALVVYWRMQSSSVALQEKISALEKSVVQLKEQPVPEVVHPPAITEEVVPQPPSVIEKDDVPALVQSSALGEHVALKPFVMATEDAERAVPENISDSGMKEQTVIKPGDLPPQVQQQVDSEAVEALPLVQDLPPSVQSILPHLKLAGHVYAKDAAKRMIIINNRICREGDLVENQLYLEQILWEGVVLRYQDIRFRMNLF